MTQVLTSPLFFGLFSAAKAQADLGAALEILNNYLNDKTYMINDQITLADITIACTLLYPFKLVCDKTFIKPYGNVVRWFMTCVNQPEFAAVVGKVEMCKKSLAAPAKKGGAKKEKKAAAEPVDAAPVPPPKVEHPYKIMDREAPSKFNMDAWKKKYSNAKSYDDAFDYFWHRANHRVTFLWRFHKAHHTDTQMDVSTALRFHPGELLLSTLAKATWVVIWGPSTIAWFVFEVLVSWCAQAHHANWDLPDSFERMLRRVWVTPRFHASHHLVDRRYGDRNFSTLLSIWDPCFGTAANPLDRAQMANLNLGLPDARAQTASFKHWLIEPGSRNNLALSQQPAIEAGH